MSASKIMPLQVALSLVKSGVQLGLGGGPVTMNPVGLVAGLLAREMKDFELVVAPIGGFAADLMIASDAVKSVEFAQLGFEELGMAPAFRQKVQAGTVQVLDHT